MGERFEGAKTERKEAGGRRTQWEWPDSEPASVEVGSLQRNSKNLEFAAVKPAADPLTLFVFDSPAKW
jgi:hypothetical protein